MKEFRIINVNIVTHREVFEGSVRVKNGKIVEVKREKIKVLSATPDSVDSSGEMSAGTDTATSTEGEEKIIDLHGQYLLPGLVDAHVHFRTPGMTQKEDWTTGSKAALAGGVTTVLDMPNTVPSTTTVDVLEQKRKIIAPDAMVNYGFYMGATEDNFEEIVKAKNVAGVKVYLGSSTGNLLMKNEKVLEKLMAESGKLLAIHAESEACINNSIRNYKLEIKNDGDAFGMKNEGRADSSIPSASVPESFSVEVDPSIHSRIRAPECASEAVESVLRLAEKHPEARVHFCHVTTAKELKLIKEFRIKNEELRMMEPLRVTLEVTPHHLFLSDEDYETYGNLVKVNPPLRSAKDQAALWKGLQDGTVDIVATDHAPHLIEEKNLPYDQVPSGVPGVQTMLPLLLHAVNDGELSLSRVVELTSWNPARIFGMVGKGAIEEGFDADLVVVDLSKVERLCHHYLWTKGDWSPFHGWYLKGWPIMTFVGGELMYEWRDKFGDAKGMEVRFS